ncbi:MAG: retroviral-like aspartic protease family protein [Candidatus Freyarchaeum deiterrae]
MKYDTIKDPPAPTIKVTIFNPISGNNVQYYGILDTGADDTAIPSNLIAELGLQKVRKKDYIDVYGRLVKEWTYYINVDFNNFLLEFIEVVALPQDEVIIGRDILNNFKIVLDGKNLHFEIHDP